MAQVARNGDSFSTGHPCTSSSTITGPTGASAKVYANGIPVECLGNPTVSHTVLVGEECIPHVSSISGGSSSVYVAGIPIARIGDACDAGSITSGSPDVFAGG